MIESTFVCIIVLKSLAIAGLPRLQGSLHCMHDARDQVDVVFSF